MDVNLIFDLINSFGLPIVALVLLYIVIQRGKMVPGWVHEKEVQEKEEWKRLALRSTDLAQDNSTTAEESVKLIGEAIDAIRRKDRLDAEADLLRRRRSRGDGGE